MKATLIRIQVKVLQQKNLKILGLSKYRCFCHIVQRTCGWYRAGGQPGGQIWTAAYFVSKVLSKPAIPIVHTCFPSTTVKLSTCNRDCIA